MRSVSRQAWFLYTEATDARAAKGHGTRVAAWASSDNGQRQCEEVQLFDQWLVVTIRTTVDPWPMGCFVPHMAPVRGFITRRSLSAAWRLPMAHDLLYLSVCGPCTNKAPYPARQISRHDAVPPGLSANTDRPKSERQLVACICNREPRPRDGPIRPATFFCLVCPGDQQARGQKGLHVAAGYWCGCYPQSNALQKAFINAYAGVT